MKKILTLSAAVVISAFSSNLMADEAMATKLGCMACHKLDMKLVGPAYKEVAAKYQGQDVAAELTKKAKNGGVGVWGQIPMPPNAASEEDIRKVVDWVLSIK